MGFNLKMFFEDLEMILADGVLDSSEKLQMLESAINEGKRYAAECGQLR